MNFEYYKDRLPEYLESAIEKKKGKRWKCPVCGVYGISNDNPALFCCHGCGTGGDIYKMIELTKGIHSPAEQYEYCEHRWGVCPENYKAVVKPQNKPQQPEDYSEYISTCKARISQTSYYRGLSEGTLDRFDIGYDSAWIHPKVIADGKQGYPTPRLIIPYITSGYVYGYLARDVRENLTGNSRAYSKAKVGISGLFNITALTTAKKPIFVVEGEIDCMSICEVGGEAIGLGSTGNKDKFLDAVKQTKPVQSLCIAMDNDNRGRETQSYLIKELTKLGIPIISPDCTECNSTAKLFLYCKDANEALLMDRERFTAIVREVESREPIQNPRPQSYSDRYSMTSLVFDWMAGNLKDDSNPISTGYTSLDSAMDGGLRKGLYVLGAISSLGKTTFILQMADYIASHGHDVMYYSLEMEKAELMFKSISRITHELSLASGKEHLAKTVNSLRSREREYNATEKELIARAGQEYLSTAQHLFIKDGTMAFSKDRIKEEVEEHIRETGNSPVVVIDYLQLIYSEKNSTDKQRVTDSVLALKSLAITRKIPVVVISSMNRASYTTPVSMSSFKESGDIEYTADVLIGLQLHTDSDQLSEAEITEMKSKELREIDVVILKQRNGQTGIKLPFRYYTRFNHFSEANL